MGTTRATTAVRSDCRDFRRYDGVTGRYHRHRTYKLTCDEFEALWQRADGRCEICGDRGDDAWPLVIDHDRNFDKSAVRGILCWNCNARFDLPSVAAPARERYLANAWYLTAPNRAAPKRIRHAVMSSRSLYLLGHSLAADAIEALLDGELPAPTEHDEQELRKRLAQLVKNHRTYANAG